MEVGGYAESYCMKCRTKKTFEVEELVTLRNGCPAGKGKCPECGTKLMRFGKKEAVA